MSSDAREAAAARPIARSLGRLPGPAARVLETARAWLGAYAQVLFGRHWLGGLLFVAATFVVPSHGLAGLAGLAASHLWARLLGRPEAHIAEGFYGFNGLLVGLALGLFFRFSATFVALLMVVSLLTVIIAAASRNLAERYLGVPVLSMPFVFATWAALLAAERFAGVEVALDPVMVADVGSGLLPGGVELFLRSLGACFFQLSVLSGALVFLGLLVISRWAAILAVLGYSSGAALYLSLGGAPSDLDAHFVGFNFILTAIAVGGSFVLLSPGSMGLALAAGTLAAIVSAALLALLEPFGLPVLALPFILTTQLLLFALALRASSGGLRTVQGAVGTPEENLARTRFNETRYPDPALPLVHLPVMGQWLVTQGHHGDETHQGLWAHAWDFEIADDEGRRWRGEGTQLEDFHAYGAPVVAPAAGKVVRVVGWLDDNAPGEVDTQNNWGNLVILWHYGGVYSALCHLQKGSVTVTEGDSVVRGQILAKVGSSGRSPVPHLHFQLQATPEIGAPTLRGELLHYVLSDAPDTYVTHGVPREGQRVRPLAVDPAVREALTLAPGLSFTWRVRDPIAESTRTERWESHIDPLGKRQLVADGGAARVDFYADEHYTTMLDFEGRPDRLLGLFYLGAARVPHTGDESLRWDDAPRATSFTGPGGRLVSELVLPFAVVGAVRTTARSHKLADLSHRDTVVRTDVDATTTPGARGRLPDRIEVTFRHLEGPVRLQAWREGRLVIDAEVIG